MYFLDLGLRNFILSNFIEPELREDRGLLFENLVLLELLTNDIYGLKQINYWRTTNQAEIDFIVKDGQDILAIETRYQKTRLPKTFRSFQKHYPDANLKLITREDFL